MGNCTLFLVRLLASNSEPLLFISQIGFVTVSSIIFRTIYQFVLFSNCRNKYSTSLECVVDQKWHHRSTCRAESTVSASILGYSCQSSAVKKLLKVFDLVGIPNGMWYLGETRNGPQNDVPFRCNSKRHRFVRCVVWIVIIRVSILGRPVWPGLQLNNKSRRHSFHTRMWCQGSYLPNRYWNSEKVL